MPLIIKGCRQCGKTFSVLDFAHKNYEYTVYLDFFQHPEYKSVFDGGLDIDTLCMTLSTLIPNANFVSGKTCIIFDEIQEYVEECTLVEVKASNGNIKSTKTILAHPEKYHVSQAVKLGDLNVGTAPQTLIIPLYMAFLLENKN